MYRLCEIDIIFLYEKLKFGEKFEKKMTEKIVLEQLELAKSLINFRDPNLIRVECGLSYSQTYGVIYGLHKQLPIQIIQLRLKNVDDELYWFEVEVLLDNYFRIV